MSKIIFLDFDGVLLTERSRQTHGYGVFAPEPVALVSKLCEESGAKLVVCSSWLGADARDVHDMMKASGLASYLHPDWRIGEGQDVQAIDKVDLIIEWAKAHECKPKDVVIIDDLLAKYPRFVRAWKDRVVSPKSEEGMQPADYIYAKKLFGLPIDKLTEQPILDRMQTGRVR